jgi:rhomboid protease GluP
MSFTQFESLVFLLWLGTSLWVKHDAGKHRIPTHGYAYTTNTGAWAWFLGCLLLWIVVFPSYLVRRRNLLARRRLREDAVAKLGSLEGQPILIDPETASAAGADAWDLVAIGQVQRLRGLQPVHLAPGIPTKLVESALKHYLRLEPGELLLAIIDPTMGAKPGQSCALTSRRIHWSDPKWKDSLAKTADRGLAPGLGLGRAGLVFQGTSIAYTELGGRYAVIEPPGMEPARAGEQPVGSEAPSEPEPGPGTGNPYKPAMFSEIYVDPGQEGVSELGFSLNITETDPTLLELDDGQKIDLGILDPGLRKAICGFLGAVGPAARRKAPVLGAAMAQEARWLLIELKHNSAWVINMQEGLRDFHQALQTATRRVVVVPALAAACAAVFAAMTASGVSMSQPSIQNLLDWGANFGPYVAVDHEYWRLFTAMFLHIGFLHLLFNMWCLLAAGPMVERLFGNLGFAAVYMISGLGGSLASVTIHPDLVSAGASGAIFGIFGALFGFLTAQHRSVPTPLLKPLRASAGSFIVYNILFGLMDHRVDNAAHLGGLVTGFVSGMLLFRRIPVKSSNRGIVRRLAAAAGLFIGLVLAARAVAPGVAARDGIRQASHSTDRAIESYNQLIASMRKSLENFGQVSDEMNALLDRVAKTDAFRPGDGALLDRLIDRIRADLEVLQKAPQPAPGLLPMLEAFITSERELREALKMLRAVHDRPDVELPGGPNSLQSKIEESNRAFAKMSEIGAAYIKAHELVVVPHQGTR